MLQDLTLKNSSGDLLGYAKIDVSNDTTNINQTQVSVNDISFVPTKDEDVKLLQEKVESNVLPTNYLFKDMHDKFTALGVKIELNGNAID